MSKHIDLTGQKFGRLTVVESFRQNGSWMLKCLCDCGNFTMATSAQLKRGGKKSCGCYKKEITRARVTKHGKTDTRQFTIWKHIKERCYQPKCPKYKNYGGRGIIMCDNWRNNFKAFYEWSLANGYADNLTIDRINNNGNYEPSNCRWVSQTEQQNNRNNNRIIIYEGHRYTAAQLAKKYKIPYKLFMGRLYNNWSVEQAIKGKR